VFVVLRYAGENSPHALKFLFAATQDDTGGIFCTEKDEAALVMLSVPKHVQQKHHVSRIK
jgi:hypothetical protein